MMKSYRSVSQVKHCSESPHTYTINDAETRERPTTWLSQAAMEYLLKMFEESASPQEAGKGHGVHVQDQN